MIKFKIMCPVLTRRRTGVTYRKKGASGCKEEEKDRKANKLNAKLSQCVNSYVDILADEN